MKRLAVSGPRKPYLDRPQISAARNLRLIDGGMGGNSKSKVLRALQGSSWNLKATDFIYSTFTKTAHRPQLLVGLHRVTEWATATSLIPSLLLLLLIGLANFTVLAPS
jgi:hypothetical protein